MFHLLADCTNRTVRNCRSLNKSSKIKLFFWYLYDDVIFKLPKNKNALGTWNESKKYDLCLMLLMAGYLQ